eukprot:4245072-Prymnesium_polylepis.1
MVGAEREPYVNRDAAWPMSHHIRGGVRGRGTHSWFNIRVILAEYSAAQRITQCSNCLLYTSDAADDM